MNKFDYAIHGKLKDELRALYIRFADANGADATAAIDLAAVTDLLSRFTSAFQGMFLFSETKMMYDTVRSRVMELQELRRHATATSDPPGSQTSLSSSQTPLRAEDYQERVKRAEKRAEDAETRVENAEQQVLALREQFAAAAYAARFWQARAQSFEVQLSNMATRHPVPFHAHAHAHATRNDVDEEDYGAGMCQITTSSGSGRVSADPNPEMLVFRDVPVPVSSTK